MLRIAGACLVILAGAYAGFYYSGRLNQRVRTLETFLAAITRISEEIRWVRLPLDKLMRLLGESEGFKRLGVFSDAAKKFEENNYTDFSSAFEWALKKHGDELGLKKTDVELLAEFGRGLGVTDTQGQTEHCRHYYDQISILHKSAAEYSARMGRLYRTIGTLIGALVVILLI